MTGSQCECLDKAVMPHCHQFMFGYVLGHLKQPAEKGKGVAQFTMALHYIGCHFVCCKST